LRYADLQAARPRWRVNLAYGVNERLLVGLEFNPAAEEVLPTLNYTLQFEGTSGFRPLLTLGTSSDRIFSPSGTRSYFLTCAQSLPGSRLSPYVSLNWSEWEDQLTIPFGMNWSIGPQWDAMVQNDGRNTHWLVTYKTSRANLSGLLVKGKYVGLSLGVKF